MNRFEKIVLRISSYSRECEMYKADNGRWYLGLADSDAYGSELFYYGPFSSEEQTVRYLNNNFSNPGGWGVDDSGERPPPRKLSRA